MHPSIYYLQAEWDMAEHRREAARQRLARQAARRRRERGQARRPLLALLRASAVQPAREYAGAP